MSTPEKRRPLDETLQDARMLVLREVGLPRETPDDHDKLKPPAMKDPDLKERVRRKAKEIMIDDELRKRRSVVPFCSLVDVADAAEWRLGTWPAPSLDALLRIAIVQSNY